MITAEMFLLAKKNEVDGEHTLSYYASAALDVVAAGLMSAPKNKRKNGWFWKDCPGLCANPRGNRTINNPGLALKN